MLVVERRQLRFLNAGRRLAITVVDPARYKVGRAYALGVVPNREICRVEVLELGDETITVRLASTDRPRFLAARSQYLYTDNPAQAMKGEPEAVDAASQQRMSAQAGASRDASRAAENAGAPLPERLRALEELAAAGNSEAARHLHVIKQRLENAERRRARGI